MLGGRGCLPETMRRGLRKARWVTAEGYISAEAFVPEPKTASTRKDGGREVSVNWEDDVEVEALTLRQQNAQHGAARVRKDEVLRIKARPSGEPALLCERAIIDASNPYHGNVVYRKIVPKHQDNALAAAIAVHSEFVPPLPRP